MNQARIRHPALFTIACESVGVADLEFLRCGLVVPFAEQRLDCWPEAVLWCGPALLDERGKGAQGVWHTTSIWLRPAGIEIGVVTGGICGNGMRPATFRRRRPTLPQSLSWTILLGPNAN